MRFPRKKHPHIGQQLPSIALTLTGDILYIFRKNTQAFGFQNLSLAVMPTQISTEKTTIPPYLFRTTDKI